MQKIARLTERKIEQSENVINRLNEKLQIIADNFDTEVTITYFVPDERKSSGAYISHTGMIKRIDDYKHTIIMKDKTIIPIGQISEIDSELFSALGIDE